MRFQKVGERYLNWLKDEALPLWQREAHDPRGGFVEALSHRGEPCRNMVKRLRVQARQAFSFARAEALGLIENGRASSDHAFGFMLDHGAHKDPHWQGGFVHSLIPSGEQKDTLLDTYDHAFVLLAAGERAKVYGDDTSKVIAQGVLTILEQLRDDHGGFVEGHPAQQPRRQNPHMHLLEAFINLRGVRGFHEIDDEAKKITDLFTEHFLDPAHMVLREFFTKEWSVDPDDGMIIEPGHMAEWAWLLMEDGTLTGAEFIAKRLLDEAIKLGGSKDAPLLCNSVDLNTGEQSPQFRLWPQTELARAHLLFRENDPSRLDRSADVIEAIFDHYLETQTSIPGGWFDEIDKSGRVISTVMPCSTLYHLMTLADEVMKALATLEE